MKNEDDFNKLDISVTDKDFSLTITHDLFYKLPLYENKIRVNEIQYNSKIFLQTLENPSIFVAFKEGEIYLEFKEIFSHSFWTNIFDILWINFLKNGIIYKKIIEYKNEITNKRFSLLILHLSPMQMDFELELDENLKFYIKITHIDLRKLKNSVSLKMFKDAGGVKPLINEKYFERNLEIDINNENMRDINPLMSKFKIEPFFDDIKLFGIYSWLMTEINYKEVSFLKNIECKFLVISINSCIIKINGINIGLKIEISHCNKISSDNKKTIYIRINYQNNPNIILNSNSLFKDLDLKYFFEAHAVEENKRIKYLDKNYISFNYETFKQLQDLFILIFKFAQIEIFTFSLTKSNNTNDQIKYNTDYSKITYILNSKPLKICFNQELQIFPFIEKIEGFHEEFKEYLERISHTWYEIKSESLDNIFRNMGLLFSYKTKNENNNNSPLFFAREILLKLMCYFNDKLKKNGRNFKYEIIDINFLQDEFVFKLRLLFFSKYKKEAQFKIKNDRLYYICSQQNDRNPIQIIFERENTLAMIETEFAKLFDCNLEI